MRVHGTIQIIQCLAMCPTMYADFLEIKYFIDVLGYNSFFSRALMNNNYTLLEKEFLMSISREYGTTVFYPYYYTPETPDSDFM